MEVKFGKPEGAAPVEVKTTEAPAPEPTVGVPAVVPTADLPAPTGLVLGDKIPSFADIILPRVNLVQNIGNLKDQFPPGGIVYGQNVLLFTPPVVDAKTGNQIKPALSPVTMTVLGFRPTRFVEKVSGGVRGLIANTEDEVRRHGGTLDYNEAKLKSKDGMKLFQPLAEALVVIERPEHIADDDTVFIYPCEGRKLALALWAMKGTSYTAAAKRIFFTARAVGCLRAGYPTHSFSVTTRLESFSGTTNQAWVPVCVPKTKSTPEFLAFAAQILNPKD